MNQAQNGGGSGQHHQFWRGGSPDNAYTFNANMLGGRILNLQQPNLVSNSASIFEGF